MLKLKQSALKEQVLWSEATFKSNFYRILAESFKAV